MESFDVQDWTRIETMNLLTALAFWSAAAMTPLFGRAFYPLSLANKPYDHENCTMTNADILAPGF